MTRTLQIFLLAPLLCNAQVVPVLNDSLSTLLRQDSQYIYRTTLAKPYLKLENRNSFIISEPVDFYGGMLGATFWGRHTLSAGFYLLEEASKKPVPLNDQQPLEQQLLRLSYFNIAYQYVLVNRRFVQINLPAEIGIGSYYAKTINSGPTPATRHYGGRFVPYSLGVQAVGKVIKWLGISASGGYRFVQNKHTLLRFNGFYFSFGLWLDARQLYRDWRYYKARKQYLQLQRKTGAD